jgi:phosphohistidine phosphatase
VRLLLIRHAVAVPRGTPGVPDDKRPLTPKGERRFRRAARGLKRAVRRPDEILTSPRLRASQTAEIAAKVWGRLTPKTESALASGSVRQMLAALAGWPKDATIAVVGHEPDLSTLLAHLLHGSGAQADRLAFRKGGAALVQVPGRPAQGGQLVWFLTPRILRALGR